MKTAIRISVVLMLAFFVMGAMCQGVTSKDQAIQYRSAFNTMLAQWNAELAGLPLEQQKSWAQQSLPLVNSGVLALNTMDIAVGLGGQPTPETIQQYLAAKNAMIDLLAKLILTKKGA